MAKRTTKARKYQQGGPIDQPDAPMRSESTERAKAKRDLEQVKTFSWPLENKNVQENYRKMERAGSYGGTYARGGVVKRSNQSKKK